MSKNREKSCLFFSLFSLISPYSPTFYYGYAKLGERNLFVYVQPFFNFYHSMNLFSEQERGKILRYLRKKSRQLLKPTTFSVNNIEKTMVW